MNASHATKAYHFALAGIAIGALRRSRFAHPLQWSRAAVKASDRVAVAVPRAEVEAMLPRSSAAWTPSVVDSALAGMCQGEILVLVDVPSSASAEAEAHHIETLRERLTTFGASSNEILLSDQSGGRTRLAFVYPLKNALDRYYAERKG